MHRVLGRGATSKVYLARQRSLDRMVVLKVLDLPPDLLKEARPRFERECAVLGALQHTNIVALLDHGLAGDQLYLVYPASDGQAMDTWVRSHGPPSALELASWIRDILGGLEAAHAAGVVHRDIKPGNLLLLPDGTAQLMDFGLAFQVGEERLTRTGVWVGTPAYASPEQILGQPLGAHSDLYALGVVAYEMLTGVQPFLGSFKEVVQRQLDHVPEAVLKIVPSVPVELSDLVMQLLQKDPADRPDDAASARRWIERILTTMRSGTYPDSAKPEVEEGKGGTRVLKTPLTPHRSGVAGVIRTRTGPMFVGLGRWRGLVARLAVTLGLALVVGVAVVWRPSHEPTPEQVLRARWQALVRELRTEASRPFTVEQRDPLEWEATLSGLPAVEEVRQRGEHPAGLGSLPSTTRRELAEVGRSFSRIGLPDPVAPYLETPDLPVSVPLDARELRILKHFGLDPAIYQPEGPTREVVFACRRSRRDLLRLRDQLFSDRPITDPVVASFREEEMGLAGQLIIEPRLARLDFTHEFRMGRERLAQMYSGSITPRTWRAIQRTRQLMQREEPDALVAWALLIDHTVRHHPGLFGGLAYLSEDRLFGGNLDSPEFRFLWAILWRNLRFTRRQASGRDWRHFIGESNDVIQSLGPWFEERAAYLQTYVSGEPPSE